MWIPMSTCQKNEMYRRVAVRRFQKVHGLEETGIIDFDTLRLQAKQDVFDYVTKRRVAGPRS